MAAFVTNPHRAHAMRAHSGNDQRVERKTTGVHALADSLDLQQPPVLQTSTACKSGMTFIEIASGQDKAGITESIQDDAFLVALQLQTCADFDLYADGRIIRPQEFSTGAIAIFDLRMNMAMDRRDPFHAVDLYIPRNSLDTLADDANASVIDELHHDPGKAFEDPIARHLLLTIQPALSAPKLTSELFIDHVAMALATHVAHTYGGMRAKDTRYGTLAGWQERRAKELIAAHLTGNITLADLAKACDLSIRHFTRAFRGSTGMSPHAWLLHLRIEKAKQILKSTRIVLADIALDCGFADQSHMTRVFQRSTGMTPSAWRRMQQR